MLRVLSFVALVCACSRAQAMTMCPTGMMPSMGTNGMPMTCMGPMDTTTCPQGSTCQMSPMMTGKGVCCMTETMQGQQMMTCPMGMTPMTMPGTSMPMTCNGPMDMTTCPMGSMCTMMPTMPGKYMCCGMGGMGMTNMCPTGMMPTTMPTTGMPMMCNGPMDMTTCPMGSMCMMSPMMTGKYMCCGTGMGAMHSMPHMNMNTMNMQCPAGMMPPMGMPMTCMGPHDTMTCPMGSMCMPSTMTPGMWTCCGGMMHGTTSMHGMMTGMTTCPMGMTPAMSAMGMPMKCTGPMDMHSCPMGTMCSTMPTMMGMQGLCCGHGMEMPMGGMGMMGNKMMHGMHMMPNMMHMGMTPGMSHMQKFYSMMMNPMHMCPMMNMMPGMGMM